MGKKDPAKAGEVFKKRDKDSDEQLGLGGKHSKKKGGKHPAEPKKEGDPAPAAPAEPVAPALRKPSKSDTGLQVDPRRFRPWKRRFAPAGLQ